MRTHRYLLIGAVLAAAGCASSTQEPVAGVNPELADHASITADSAALIAMDYLPGWEVHQSELEPYQNGVWYEFELQLDDTDTELRVDANTGRIFEPATVEQQPGQLLMAAIPDARARQLALARTGGGRIIKGDIEVEDGVLLYTYEITKPGMAGITIIDVDATTGSVLAQSHQLR
jgi:uncharacterized membrane protein YkoI